MPENLNLEEWVVLLKEAKKIGITIEDIKLFFKEGAIENEKRSSGKIC